MSRSPIHARVHDVRPPAALAQPAPMPGRALSLQTWLPALTWATGGLVLSLLWQLLREQGWWAPILMGAGVCAWILWHRIAWPDVWSRYLSFGAVLLLACLLNRLLYAVDYLVAEPRTWPFYVDDAAMATIKAESMTIIGTLLTLAAWLKAGGLRHSPGELLQLPRASLLRVLGLVYLTSLGAIAISALAPQIAAVTGQLLPTLLVLGASSAFFLPLLLAQRRVFRLAVAALLALPFLYVAIGTGMKENVLLAFAPLAFLLWHSSRRRSYRATLVGGGLVMLALVTAYIGFFRHEIWYADRAVDQSEVLEGFADSVSEQGLPSTVGVGMQEFLARSNAADYRGWTAAIADSDGFQPQLVFEPLLYVFVPRVIWPGKPEIRQGLEYSGLVFGDSILTWNESSLSAGFYPSLYLGGGWLAVIVGALLVGWMVAALTRLAARVGGPALAGLFMVSLLPYALRLDEAWTVGAISAPLVSFVYLTLVYTALRLLSGLLSPRQAPV